MSEVFSFVHRLNSHLRDDVLSGDWTVEIEDLPDLLDVVCVSVVNNFSMTLDRKDPIKKQTQLVENIMHGFYKTKIYEKQKIEIEALKKKNSELGKYKEFFEMGFRLFNQSLTDCQTTGANL